MVLFIHMESWGAERQGAHRQAPLRDTGSLGGTEPVSTGLGDGLLGVTLVLASQLICAQQKEQAFVQAKATSF